MLAKCIIVIKFTFFHDRIVLTYLKWVSLTAIVLPTLKFSTLVSKNSGQTKMEAIKRTNSRLLQGFVFKFEFRYSAGCRIAR